MSSITATRPEAVAPRAAARRASWREIGTLPLLAAVLVAINAVYILLVASGNVTDFGTNQAFVQHVMSMDTTNFGAKQGTHLDPNVMWRAVTTPWIQNAAYVALIAWEALTGIVLATGVVLWIRERGTGYRAARALSSVGLLMLLVLFMGGFIAIGGEYFQMWRSTAWNGLDAAFRNATLAFLTLVLLHLPVSQTSSATPVATSQSDHAM